MAEREIKIIDGDYSGKPPRPVGRILDLLIGGAMFVSPLWSRMSYLRILLPAAGFGVAFAVVQYILNRKEPSAVRKSVSLVLRIFAGLVLAFLVILVFGIGNSIGWTYPLRKSLYRIGNGIEASALEFMPDSIPAGSTDISVRFYSANSDGLDEARICFTADEEGVKEMRETALAKGGALAEEESFVYKKLRVYAESLGRTLKDAEVYSMGEADRQCPAYLIEPETGFCVVYW